MILNVSGILFTDFTITMYISWISVFPADTWVVEILHRDESLQA